MGTTSTMIEVVPEVAVRFMENWMDVVNCDIRILSKKRCGLVTLIVEGINSKIIEDEINLLIANIN